MAANDAQLQQVLNAISAASTTLGQRQQQQSIANEQFMQSIGAANSEVISGFTPGLMAGAASIAPFAFTAGAELANSFTQSRAVSESSSDSEAERTKKATEEAGEKAKKPTTTAKADEEKGILDQVAESVLNSEAFQNIIAGLSKGAALADTETSPGTKQAQSTADR